jgi:hypothetical protein
MFFPLNSLDWMTDIQTESQTQMTCRKAAAGGSEAAPKASSVLRINVIEALNRMAVKTLRRSQLQLGKGRISHL